MASRHSGTMSTSGFEGSLLLVGGRVRDEQVHEWFLGPPWQPRTEDPPLLTTLEPSTSDARRRRGLLLEYLTIGWNVIEAVIAVTAGIAAGSIALVAFGFDSSIEVFAASVVVWQFRAELRRDVDEDRERRALKLIAVTFFVLRAYVTTDAIRDVIVDEEAEASLVGIILASVSLVVMPTLAWLKRLAGRALNSSTLIADSAECGGDKAVRGWPRPRRTLAHRPPDARNLHTDPTTSLTRPHSFRDADLALWCSARAA